jgi:hypothetical protein
MRPGSEKKTEGEEEGRSTPLRRRKKIEDLPVKSPD